jgi:beta-xylosidase
LAPAGGVKNGWQLALRSKNVMGPYEVKRVMEQGSTNINGPHQGAWVELDNDENWFIHFQDRGAYGRIVHINPVRWVNDWPLMGVDLDGNGVGEPVTEYKKPDVGKTWPVIVPQTSDEFDSGKLGLQWQWHANYQDEWMSLTEKSNHLRLYSVPVPNDAINFWAVPNLVLQKFPAPEFTVTTKIDFSKLSVDEKSGLIVMGMDYSYLAIERMSSGYQLIKRSCKNAGENGKEIEEDNVDCMDESLLLRVEINNEAVCNFSYSLDGEEFTLIGKPFTARPGRWIGAKIGLFCLSQDAEQKPGYADYDWFRFE